LLKFDLVVVGGGTGGSVTADALAKVGYSVCVLDQKTREEMGEKVCGDAVGKHHFSSLEIAPPKGKELDNKILGIDVFSPDSETVFKIKGEGLHGFVIDRLMFGQRLLKNALDKGVELFDRTLVLEPIFKDGFVIGVEAKNFRENKRIKIFGKAVVDASGMAAVLRKKMPIDWGIERKISAEDIEICYREIRETKKSIEDPTFLKIFLNQKISERHNWYRRGQTAFADPQRLNNNKVAGWLKLILLLYGAYLVFRFPFHEYFRQALYPKL